MNGTASIEAYSPGAWVKLRQPRPHRSRQRVNQGTGLRGYRDCNCGTENPAGAQGEAVRLDGITQRVNLGTRVRVPDRSAIRALCIAESGTLNRRADIPGTSRILVSDRTSARIVRAGSGADSQRERLERGDGRRRRCSR